MLHPRRRHSVLSRVDRQRPRERDEPDFRRLGWPLRVAAVLRRVPSVLDAGRRLIPGPRQFARHGRRRGWQNLHVGSGDDLAVEGGVPARLRGADGLDDQGSARGESQPRGRCERQEWQGADSGRRCCWNAADTRRDRNPRCRRQRPDISLVLLSRGWDRHSRSACRCCRSRADRWWRRRRGGDSIRA